MSGRDVLILVFLTIAATCSVLTLVQTVTEGAQ